MEAASQIAQRCRQQAAAIARMVNDLGIACDFRERASLYVAGDKLDAADLREERRLRAHAGITGAYLAEGELAAQGFVGEGALLYPGSAEADPAKLALGLLAAAQARGAVLLCPATAENYEASLSGVTVTTRESDIVRARTLVLANGYEMPDVVSAPRHSLVSSWTPATAPIPVEAWPGQSLVWEASAPYLYMRSTADGRVIIAGEDEDIADPDAREALTPVKIAALQAKAAARCPSLPDVAVEFAWSGVLGQTDDSLPLIGAAPGRPHCLAAFGYGGNGITFSAMAAELLDAHLRGEPWKGAPLFALDRD
jgi:glycine/D-amino acid oxidase-like deaminating enzyme